MRSPFLIASLATLLASTVSTLGINCRGSGLCPLATWDNQSPLPVMQILRDALYESKAPESTPYNNGDHVLCISNTLTINLSIPIIDPTGLTSGLNLGSWHLGGRIKDGGICLFPQYMKNGPLTLGMIRKLADKLLEHGCETCGSVPIHFVDKGSNDPGDGILTFNYVRHTYCTENCLNDRLGLESSNNKTTPVRPRMARRLLADVPADTATAVDYQSSKGALMWRKVTAAIGIPASAMASAVPNDSPKAALLTGGNTPQAAREHGSKQPRESTPNEINTRNERSSASLLEKRGLSSRSAKFGDLDWRRNGGSQENKGWIGWLRS